jgi:aminoglycoside 6-adenylyltransferase
VREDADCSLSRGGPRHFKQVLVDALSDYDLIVAVRDATEFAANWADPYGEPLCGWRDSTELDGHATYFRGATYADGVCIDYSVWPERLLAELAAAERLPAVLDVGYRVLVDKSGATGSWPAPTYRAHIPSPPTQDEFDESLSDFWWHANKTAKALTRGDVVLAKHILEADLRRVLRRMLEWRLQIDHDWSLAPGAHGRGLERPLDSETWSQLAATYAGADPGEDWDALFRTTALLRRTALELADALDLSYPRHTGDAMSARLDALHSGSR